MSWMAPKLRHRIQIRTGAQTPNDDGGFDRSYVTLCTVWAEIKTMKGIREFFEVIRGETISDSPTHEITVRYTPIKQLLGKGFTGGFSEGFDSEDDIVPVKSDYFVFWEQGSTTKGRLYKIVDIKIDEERKEWLIFRARQIEEQGTGYPV